jgi:hypothetical protein
MSCLVHNNRYIVVIKAQTADRKVWYRKQVPGTGSYPRLKPNGSQTEGSFGTAVAVAAPAVTVLVKRI